MKIADVIHEDLILPQLRARDGLEAIRELGSFLAEHHETVGEEEAIHALAERERLGSTALAEDLAIPHAKLDRVPGLVACFGRSPKGIDFGSPNGERTHFFFVLLAPESAPGAHLKALARISRLFRDAGFRARLMAARTANEMYEIIAAQDAE